MTTPIYIVDAFANRPFSGNPAAVCPLARPASAEWMQSVARELNLSETAFVVPGLEAFQLRWFTPRFEVDLCGHATLASAHILWETGRVPSATSIRFSTRSGILRVDLLDGFIRMDLPIDTPELVEAPRGLAEALGSTLECFGRGSGYEFALVASENALRRLTPSFARLAELIPVGICVTAAADAPEYDFVSRFFAPSAGIDEDPVTGSAHCLLAPFWGERLGKSEMRARQVSERGGDLRVTLLGDRVAVDGQAVTVSAGELLPADG